MTEGPIGFIGLGNMGGRIARRLVDAGFTVIGTDVDPGAAVRSGATPAGSAGEVSADCDIVMMSLPDSHVVEDVVLSPGGLLAVAREGQVVVDLSTAEPDSTRNIHDQLLERGAQYVDAGVSGGAAAAEKGALTIMAGGDQAVVDALRSVFAPFATAVHYMGPSGSGHVTKILNNFLNAVSLSATAEVMVAARKSGLDLDVLLEVLNSSSGVNFATLNRFPRIVHGDYLEGGLSGGLMTKDLKLYVDYLGRIGVPSLNASGPLATFGLSNHLGYEHAISNRVVDAVGDVAGGIRLHTPDHDEPEDQS
jgi:3-hydroxyisobutyrate dehydrogenase